MMSEGFKMEVPSVEESKEIVNKAIEAFLEMYDAPDESVNHIKYSIAEILDNCRLHAYIDEIGPVFIFCKMLKNNVINIIIKDKGVGIVNINEAMTPLFTTKKGNSGLGFTVAEALMDSLQITSIPGRGTKVNMKKQII